MRNRTSFITTLAIIGLLQTVTRDAHADPPASTQTGAAAPSSERTGEWGFIVLASGLVAGAALTTYGLTFDCADDSRACQRHASLAIWGGVGIASLSSAIGIAIVQMGRSQIQMTATGLKLEGVF